MSILRRAARPLLASIFIYDGIDAIVDSGSHAAKFLTVHPLMEKTGVPAVIADDAKTMAKITGTITCLCGTGLALGIAPKFNAAALAALNLPITAINAVYTLSHQSGSTVGNAHPDLDSTLTTPRTLDRTNQEALHIFLQGAAIAGGLFMAISDSDSARALNKALKGSKGSKGSKG